MLSPATVIFAILTYLSYVQGNDLPSTVVSWEFDLSTQGWGDAAAEEMEVQLETRDGYLGGILLGNRPFLDSPPLDLLVDDKYVIVIRMQLAAGQGHLRGSIVTSKSENWDDWVRDKRNGFDKSSIQMKFSESIVANGKFDTYVIPIWESVAGRITRLRLWLQVHNSNNESFGKHRFQIDWIRIVKAPTITKVQGCIDRFFNSLPDDMISLQQRDSHSLEPVGLLRLGRRDGEDRIHRQLLDRNGDYAVHATVFDEIKELGYAGTFNCRRTGGTRIQISGKNFGTGIPTSLGEKPTIMIGHQACLDIETVIPEKMYRCTLPPLDPESTGSPFPALQQITVQNRDYHQVFDKKFLLEYAVPAEKLNRPNVTNVASHSIDLTWELPGSFHSDHVTITGFVVQNAVVDEDDFGFPIQGEWTTGTIVTNVTTTTIVDLPAQTRFVFRIAALVEDQTYFSQSSSSADWTQGDLYARRNLVPNALIGQFSNATEAVSTLKHDIEFHEFDAEATQSFGPKCTTPLCSSKGLSGNEQGEGSYGLALVGSSNIRHCGTASTCCDSFNATAFGSAKCPSYVCTADISVGTDSKEDSNSTNSWITHQNEVSIGVMSDLPHEDQTLIASIATKPCGTSVLLTPSLAHSVGAIWYQRQQNVREGFDTRFTFEISEQSMVCQEMNDVFTRCRTRGADGLAFVIQSEGLHALGKGGAGLGCRGIKGGLFIELDTFHSPETGDAFENHITVLADSDGLSGKEIASSAVPTALNEGKHTVRILYYPNADHSWIQKSQIQLTKTSTTLMLPGALQGEHAPLGMLHIYLDDLETPVLSTFLNIDHGLPLQSGRAWLGFTASTGGTHYQTHELFDWQFNALRKT